MASYNVSCNDADYVSQQEKPKTDIYKPSVTIPTKHDELLLMSSNKAYSKHPGVQAALKSFQSGKGSNFAYVLVFADAWSPIMETFWDCRYPWDKISDCRFHVPLDKLGVSNAELRIITVIGLGNEPDENYRIIATLDDYISDNPQLKDASPTAIILTHDSQDEGISEKHNVFQCKLQALGELKAQIVNQKYSNVVFLLRMPAQWNVNFENLEKNIARFETAIHEHWSLPEPTHIILDWFCLEAVKVNGYCKLPSGEYFPRNLKERLKVICMKSSDPLGNAIFEAAFAYDSTDDVFEDKTYTEVDLLPANHSKVDEYGYLAENPLMAQLISRTKTREQELKKESLASLSGVLDSVDDRMSKTEALIQELKAELEKKKT